MAKKIPYISFVVFWILLCLFSFTGKDPNLTIYNYPIIRDVITCINDFGSSQKLNSSIIFAIISMSLFINYLYIIKNPELITKDKITKTLLILLITGLFAYPFLSHDIFNYLFNSKMILVYNKDPHLHTALEFDGDLWTRFMHNTHTAAPYGRLFTYLSLIPGFLGFSNFTLTFLLMKLFNCLFFIASARLIYLISKQNKQKALKNVFIFLFNPLLLTEVFINGHNDGIMVFLALFSVYFIKDKKIISLVSYLGSIFIKYATIVLAPIYIVSQRMKLDFFFYSSLALYFVLLARIGQTHAWYLMWGFSFAVLSKSKKLKLVSILLTFGALLRYVPFIKDSSLYPSQDYLLLLVPLLLLVIPKFRRLLK
jgi:hypothetical protein